MRNNYFSFVDNFNLQPTDLLNLSPYNLNSILNDLNVNEKRVLSNYINDLKNPEIGKHHYAIEIHFWLKQLLLKNFELITEDNIVIEDNIIEDKEGFKNFIEPYLKPIISDIITYFITNEKYKELYRILEQDIYSSQLKKRIISVLKGKLNYANDYLDERLFGRIKSNINYVKSYHFINTLNLFPNAFKTEITKLYHTILKVHDSYNIKSKDPNFLFSSQALVAFGNSELDDVAIKLLIDNNADNAKQYAYRRSNEATVKESNTNILKGIGVALAFIVFISTVGLSSYFSKQNKPKTPTKAKEKKEKLISNKPKKKRNNYDNRIRFYYSLKRKVNRNRNNSNLTPANIDSYINPYPKTFKLLPTNKTAFNTTSTLIHNKTNNDLIIFRLIKGKDQAVYIPKDQSTFITLLDKDSILFYTGKDFIVDKFSHFKTQDAISEIYKIEKTESLNTPEITVNPINKTAKKEDKIIGDNKIEVTSDINLKKLSINSLYKDYYYSYSN